MPQIINAKTGDITENNPITPVKKKEEDDPLYFGGMDLAKVVHSSAIDILELKDDVLYERAWNIWPHVNYTQVSKDTHKIFKKYPMFRMGKIPMLESE